MMVMIGGCNTLMELMISIPKNHREIDKEWNEWKPTSPGSLRFKNMVNDIETMAKYQNDELNF